MAIETNNGSGDKMKKGENMVKNELKELYAKVISEGIKLRCCSSSIDFENIFEHFQSIESPDPPDGILILDKTLYVIEHFQFSIYWDEKNGDRLKKAYKSKSLSKTKGVAEFLNKEDGWGKALLENWFLGFSHILDAHMEKYNTYIKEAQKKRSDLTTKFIFVIEDNSHSVITENDLCILDICEFVEKILSNDKIDGVILFSESLCGSVLLAKDKYQLQDDLHGEKLCSLNSCWFLTILKQIQELTIEEQECIKQKIASFLVTPKGEMIMLDDSLQIEKHE